MMNFAAETRFLQGLAEDMMTDVLHVTRQGSVPVTDPDTFEVTYPAVTVYQGPGYIQSSGAGADAKSGPMTVTVHELKAHLPASTMGAVRVGDLVSVEASVSSPGLAGAVFVVDRLLSKSRATANRVQLKEVV